MTTLKISLVGDADVGKTTLCKLFTNNTQNNYDLTHYFLSVNVFNNELYNLCLCDVRSDMSQELLRSSLEESDVVIFCFSVDNATSLKHIKKKWFVEVQKYAPSAVYVLAALKCDLLNEEGTNPEFIKMKDKIRASKLVECSSEVNEDARKVFKKATEAFEESKNEDKEFTEESDSLDVPQLRKVKTAEGVTMNNDLLLSGQSKRRKK